MVGLQRKTSGSRASRAAKPTQAAVIAAALPSSASASIHGAESHVVATATVMPIAANQPKRRTAGIGLVERPIKPATVVATVSASGKRMARAVAWLAAIGEPEIAN